MSATRAALDNLASCIRNDLVRADRHVAELESWRTTPPAGHGTYAAALLLHHLYTAIEAILERALRTFDRAVPEGKDSHVNLLKQAASPVEGVRDVVLPEDTAIRTLLLFRHRLRKRYDDELDPMLLHPVITGALHAWPRIRGHLVRFAAFTEECAKMAP